MLPALLDFGLYHGIAVTAPYCFLFRGSIFSFDRDLVPLLNEAGEIAFGEIRSLVPHRRQRIGGCV